MVYLDRYLKGAFFDAKYAGFDNFVGAPIDGYFLNRVAGTKELADALQNVLKKANSLGYSILIWDAYRPVRAVEHFLLWAEQPEDGRTKQAHYPNIEKREIIPQGYVAAHSSHSRGSTVDLTLCDTVSGEPVDTDGIFDLMDEKSHHDNACIKSNALKNRNMLRTIMMECGFKPYENEWWHYTLNDEPYPDTYFDIPIDDQLEK